MYSRLCLDKKIGQLLGKNDMDFGTFHKKPYLCNVKAKITFGQKDERGICEDKT